MRSKIHALFSSSIYSAYMVICIIASIVPLAFRSEHAVFTAVEMVSTVVFTADYLMSWLTADLDAPEQRHPFALYPVQPMAVIDLLSILPSFTALNNGLKLLRLFRLARMLRVFRVFRAFRLARYSRNVRMIINVLRSQRDSLLVVCVLAIAYIIISALIVFNVEPETFNNFFEAIYWATISLTTMGYGDIYPVSPIGRLFTMISSLLGIAIVALPAGIITAGYMDEIKKEGVENGKKKKSPDLETAETVNENQAEDCKSDRYSDNTKRSKS